MQRIASLHHGEGRSLLMICDSRLPLPSCSSCAFLSWKRGAHKRGCPATGATQFVQRTACSLMRAESACRSPWSNA
jgi:hypothetical protein